MKSDIEIKTKIKKVLSGLLGLEPEDIKYEDSLESDLHMSPTDMSELATLLEENSFDTSKLDFTEIETVEDLSEALS